MKSKTVVCALVALLVSAFPFATAQSSTNAKVQVDRVAQPEKGALPVVSPGGTSVAAVVRQGSRLTVTINGKPGPTLQQVSIDTFVFSPDGKRHAYIGTKSGKHYLFVDGQSVVEVPKNRWKLIDSNFSRDRS